MVWVVDNNGLAEEKNVSLRVLNEMTAAGRPYWATLTGAILQGGVNATAFKGAIGREPLFDTRAVLANGTSTKGLEPCAFRPVYQVECLNGEIHEPALSREGAMAWGFHRMSIETGERPWHVALLDAPEVTVFLIADSRDALEQKLDKACRKLYPDYHDHSEAWENVAGLTLWTGKANGPGSGVHAAALLPGLPDATPIFVLGGDELEITEKLNEIFEERGARIGVMVMPADTLEEAHEIGSELGYSVHSGYTWLAEPLIDEVVQRREGPSSSMDFG